MWEANIRRLMWILLGLAAGILGTGLVFLISSQPKGVPIKLNPKPTPAPVVIHISGAVKNPGVYTLPAKSRIFDAVEAAGGYLPSAEIEVMNLAQYVEDGDKISVPTPQPTQLLSISLFSSQPPGITADSKKLININLASYAELDSLPGIGEERCRQIIAYRQENGPFTSIDQIQKVPGIGPKIFENIKPYITVEP